MQGI
jgi:hypothetical protein